MFVIVEHLFHEKVDSYQVDILSPALDKVVVSVTTEAEEDHFSIDQHYNEQNINCT